MIAENERKEVLAAIAQAQDEVAFRKIAAMVKELLTLNNPEIGRVKAGFLRLHLAPDLITWIAKIRAGGFSILNVEDHHLAAYAKLPAVKDHRDPFDRMLIAQALTEDLTLVSRDGKFGEYAGLKLHWS